MHQLPTEVFHLIFRHLNLNQLSVCRLVCVRWRFVVQGYIFRIRSLAICRKVDLPNKGVHFLTNVPINASTAAHVRNLNFFKVEMYRTILSRLRCLYMDFIYRGFHNFYLYIDECKALEQLQIDNFTNNKLMINLPNLRIMCVQDMAAPTKSYKLILNTPNLFAFMCSGQFSYIHFSYPAKITHLCLYDRFNDQIRCFENLRFLYLTFTYSIQSPTFSLAKFEKLEEFHFLSLGHTYLESLFTPKHKEKPKVKLFCAGFPVKSMNEYYRISPSYTFYCSKAYKSYLFANYSDLSSFVPWVQEIDFGSMLHSLGEIPPDFFSKFVNIKKVNLTQMISRVDQLVNFLTNCRVLKELYVFGSLLPQTVFSALPEYCPFLTVLEIIEAFPIENLRFLLKFDYLERVRIEQNATVSVVMKAMRKESIKHFAFHFRNEKFVTKKKIEPDPTKIYEDHALSKHFEVRSPTNDVSFDSLDEMIGFLKVIMINSK